MFIARTSPASHSAHHRTWSLLVTMERCVSAAELAYSYSSLLQMVVWSMISGHLVNRLTSPLLQEKQARLVHGENCFCVHVQLCVRLTHLLEDGDSAVHKLLFLDQRKSRMSATLVASGPGGTAHCTTTVHTMCYIGHIHFWSLLSPSKPKGVFQAVSNNLVVQCSHCLILSE